MGLCASAGYEASGGILPVEPAEPAKKKAKKAAAPTTDEEELAMMGGLGGSSLDNGKTPMPKNQPLWLNLPAAPSVLVDDMPTETLLLFGEDNARKALFTNVDKFLAEF